MKPSISKLVLGIGLKITLTFASLFIVIVLIAGFSLNKISTRRTINSSYENVQNINHLTAENIKSFLGNEKEAVKILAMNTAFRNFLILSPESPSYQIEKQNTSEMLVRTTTEINQISELFILNKDGKIVVSTDPTKEGLDRSQDPYFINAKDEVYIKDFYYSDIVKKNAYSVSSPIKNSDTGEFLGIIVACMNPENLYEILPSNIDIGQTSENFLINGGLYFISKSRFLNADAILKKKDETPNTKDCFITKDVTSAKSSEYENNTDYRNVPIVEVHSYIPEVNWCLITKMDLSEVLTSSNELVIIFFQTGLFAVLIFLIMGYILSRRIVKPLQSLREGTEIIEAGNLDFKVGTNNHDEIGELSRSFDKMTLAIKKSHASVDQKVREQTDEILKRSQQMENQQKATLNLLEDVEKAKKKTELLVKDLEKFKLAVDISSDHIVITNADGIILYTNKAVEKITGFSAKEVIGQKAGSLQNWGGLMDKSFYASMWYVIKTYKNTFIGGMKNHRKNGEEYIVYTSISPIFDENHNVLFFVGVERDITKEKEIDKAKTEFVSLASHQLRTPLSSINWYAEMLLAGDAGQVSEEQQKYLKEIYIGNQRMVELVNSLLNVSRLDLGTFIIEPTPTDVLELAKSVLNELKPQIIIKHIIIKESYDEHIPLFNADQKLLRMVFQNLLSNAIKYTTDTGTVSLRVSILTKGTILAEKEIHKDVLAISVTDTGMGIPEGQKDKIFSKLFRADNAQESEAEGTGLGLYIIKSITNQSGGEIWFTSQENKGSTFYVVFPLSGMEKKEGTKQLD